MTKNEPWQTVERYDEVFHPKPMLYTFPPLDKTNRLKFIQWLISGVEERIESLQKKLSTYKEYQKQAMTIPDDMPYFHIDEFLENQ